MLFCHFVWCCLDISINHTGVCKINGAVITVICCDSIGFPTTNINQNTVFFFAHNGISINHMTSSSQLPSDLPSACNSTQVPCQSRRTICKSGVFVSNFKATSRFKINSVFVRFVDYLIVVVVVVVVGLLLVCCWFVACLLLGCCLFVVGLLLVLFAL